MLSSNPIQVLISSFSYMLKPMLFVSHFHQFVTEKKMCADKDNARICSGGG